MGITREPSPERGGGGLTRAEGVEVEGSSRKLEIL